MPCTDKEKAKEYMREYRKTRMTKEQKKHAAGRKSQRVAELREWMREVKSGLSCPCGENHIACLEFHHQNSKKKEFDVSNFAKSGYSKDKVLAEIAKCIVMCSNCHRKHHWNEKIGV